MLLHHFKTSWRNLLKYKVQNAISIACLAVGVVCFAITVYFMYGFGRSVYYNQIKQDLASFSVLAAPYEETERLRKTGSFPENAQLYDDFFNRLLSLKLPAMEGLHGYVPITGVDQTFYDNTDLPKTCNCYYTHSSPRYWMYYGYRSAITGEPIPELEENDCLITDDLSAQLFGKGTDPRGFEYAMGDGTGKRPIRDVIKVTDRLDAHATNTVVIIRNAPQTAREIRNGFTAELAEGYTGEDLLEQLQIAFPEYTFQLHGRDFDNDELFLIILIIGVVLSLGASVLIIGVMGFLKMELQLFRMRQREVALRRVHGAKSGSIFRLFACETLFTFVFTGIVAGILATLLIDFANASLTPYLNEFGWHIEGVYESVAVILLAVVLISFFVVWLTVRAMMHQRQSMTMQLQRSRGHALRNTMLGIQIAICILFVGGSIALTHFSELALREMNVPENDDFYKECIIVRPYKSYLESPKLLEYLRTEAQDVERFIPMNLELLQSKEIQEDSVANEEQGTVYIRECMVNDTAIFDFWNRSINWILPPEERHDCILMNDSLYAMMERYGFNRNGWFLPVDRQPLRIGGTFSTWPYADKTRISQRYQVVHLGNWRDEEMTEIIVQPKKGAYDRVFADLTEAMQRINPKPLEQRVTNLRDALDDEIFFIEIMRDASWILSSICLVICLMGIWSTIALDTRSRQKEVALRKIHGAKRGDIALLFGRLYLWLIGIATIVSTPLIILFNTLLKDLARGNFVHGMAERLSPTLPILGALIITALIILLIVGYHLHQVLRVKPAEMIAKE